MLNIKHFKQPSFAQANHMQTGPILEIAVLGISSPKY